MRSSNKSGGAANTKQRRLEKKAVSAKGRMHQPKGKNNPKGHTDEIKRQRVFSKDKTMADMEF